MSVVLELMYYGSRNVLREGARNMVLKMYSERGAHTMHYLGQMEASSHRREDEKQACGDAGGDSKPRCAG